MAQPKQNPVMNMRGGRPGPGAMGGKKPKNTKATLKRLIQYITGTYKASFILVIVFILLSAAAGVAGSLFIQRLVDDFITPLLQQAVPDFSGLLRTIIVMAVIYLVGIASTLLFNLLMVTIAQGVQKRIRDDLFAHMQTLPIKYFDTHTFGDVMSHYTNDIDTLRQMISQSIPQLISSFTTIVFVLAAMFYVNVVLTLIMLVMLGLMLLATRKIGGASSKFFVAQQKDLGATNGYIEEMINGQKVVKVFTHEREAEQDFDKLNDALKGTAASANKFANIMGPVNNALGNFSYVIVAFAGGALAVSGMGGITLGAIASFLSLSKAVTMPIGQVSQQFSSVIMAMAGAERIFALMDEPSEVDDGYVTLVNARYDANGSLTETKERTGTWAWKHPHHDGTLTYTEVKGDVRFYDVDFGYSDDKIVLHDITLYGAPGEKIAFVGATGAGKTTITNLINRFYDVQDGKIRYDGININKIKKADLRRSLGIVLQDTNLFTGSIMENIRYGNLAASDDEVKAAARLANADGFIRRLPQGYDTELSGDGADLSQGQRQLLSIARAAVADPPVMILDEATSSIDTRTEAIVQRGMDSLMHGRTVFVIAHRLSTVQNSDVIMVLELGHIIERGSHEQLLAEKGKYYQLYTGAFELE